MLDFTFVAHADFSSFVVTTDVSSSLLMRSPRVRVITFASCTRHIYTIGFRAVLDFVLRRKLVHPIVPDVISVRQVEALPPASFRFHLAMDTLALG